jgi:hypothetical protein
VKAFGRDLMMERFAEISRRVEIARASTAKSGDEGKTH